MVPIGARRVALVAVDLFAGLTAVGGGLGLLLHAYEMPLELLAGSPFTSYTVPALTLTAAVGGSATAAGIGVLRRRAWGAPLSAAAGVVLLGFEAVELLVIGLSWLQALYAAVGLLMLGLAAPAIVARARRPMARG